MEEDRQLSRTSIGEASNASCERCRRRKIKCDRRQPCGRCRKAGTECILKGTGEKQRPIPKSYVQALEGQVASLELFIGKLATADNEQRDVMLKEFAPSALPNTAQSPGIPASYEAQGSQDVGLARTRAGQLRKQRAGKASQFYGGTSLFQFHAFRNLSVPEENNHEVMDLASSLQQETSPGTESSYLSGGGFQFAPHDSIIRRLVAIFFTDQYQYNMCVYREYFLRDYDAGAGRYYSDVLLYAICATGALASRDPALLPLSEMFSKQAQILLFSSLDSPDLTILQALLLLGQREIGSGNTSRGWLLSGMAFRLAHEMGLNLDPENWAGASETSVDREILRRVYWAAFVADKQLSLYFGRPPALYPHESDVRNTIRLPYPPDWEGLLDTYIAKDTSAHAFEDGIAFVGSFIYQVELSKILHGMITELFENRQAKAATTVVATTVQKIHVSLTKWLASLPGKLHWNQWSVGKIPPAVLHLHMLFHMAMIILHRPPQNLFRKPGISTSEDVEICYESLQAIFRLMRSYSRYYRYVSLPLDFVHILATAAGTIMMKRFFEDASWDESEISKSLSLVLQAMDEIQETWPCVKEIKDYIVQATQSHTYTTPQADPIIAPGITTDSMGNSSFLVGLGVPGEVSYVDQTEVGIPGINLGPLVTDDFLGGEFTWDSYNTPS